VSRFYPSDFQTDAWRRVEDHLQQLLAKDREVLEGQGLDDKPTQAVRLRARIGLLRSLLDLPEATLKAAEGVYSD
jgi:hypothetical protein